MKEYNNNKIYGCIVTYNVGHSGSHITTCSSAHAVVFIKLTKKHLDIPSVVTP